MGEAAALVASLQAEQASLAQQIAEAEQASASGARLQERDQVSLPSYSHLECRQQGASPSVQNPVAKPWMGMR